MGVLGRLIFGMLFYAHTQEWREDNPIRIRA